MRGLAERIGVVTETENAACLTLGLANQETRPSMMKTPAQLPPESWRLGIGTIISHIQNLGHVYGEVADVVLPACGVAVSPLQQSLKHVQSTNKQRVWQENTTSSLPP